MQEKSSFALPEHIRITKKMILNRIMFLCVLKVVCVVQTFYANKHLCAHGLHNFGNSRCKFSMEKQIGTYSIGSRVFFSATQ